MHICKNLSPYICNFKELVHVIVEVGKFKICKVGQQVTGPRRVDAAVKVWRLAEFPFIQGANDFTFYFIA